MRKQNNIFWVTASTSGAILSSASYLYVAYTSTSYDNGNEISGILSGAVAFICIVSFIVSIITLFKIKKWAKVIPIIGILVSLVVFALAFFAYSFSGYGS